MERGLVDGTKDIDEPYSKRRKVDTQNDDGNEIIIEHKAIPELGLSDIVSPSKSLNQIFQSCIYYQNFFKNKPLDEKVKCFSCDTMISTPERWKGIKYDPKHISEAMCERCKFSIELSSRCIIWENWYFENLEKKKLM
jgi:hypothetical protein